jgi:hypothetical protein
LLQEGTIDKEVIVIFGGICDKIKVDGVCCKTDIVPDVDS